MYVSNETNAKIFLNNYILPIRMDELKEIIPFYLDGIEEITSDMNNNIAVKFSEEISYDNIIYKFRLILNDFIMRNKENINKVLSESDIPLNSEDFLGLIKIQNINSLFNIKQIDSNNIEINFV